MSVVRPSKFKKQSNWLDYSSKIFWSLPYFKYIYITSAAISVFYCRDKKKNYACSQSQHAISLIGYRMSCCQEQLYRIELAFVFIWTQQTFKNPLRTLSFRVYHLANLNIPYHWYLNKGASLSTYNGNSAFCALRAQCAPASTFVIPVLLS